MKEKLLLLLSGEPAMAGRSAEFLDTLAEDLTAVIIRALLPGDPTDPVQAIEHQAEDIYLDHFGVKLSNLFAVEPFHGKKKLYFSARKRVIMSMLVAMLVEQADQYDRNDSEQAGETLKYRLNDLALKPTTVIN